MVLRIFDVVLLLLDAPLRDNVKGKGVLVESHVGILELKKQ